VNVLIGIVARERLPPTDLGIADLLVRARGSKAGLSVAPAREVRIAVTHTSVRVVRVPCACIAIPVGSLQAHAPMRFARFIVLLSFPFGRAGVWFRLLGNNTAESPQLLGAGEVKIVAHEGR
jgi:hypothetical protein